MPTTSRRMAASKASTIVQINNKARALKAEGRDILNFSIGVPNFPPAQHIIDAAHKAVDEHSLGYLPGRGSEALISAFQQRLAADGLGDYAVEEVCAAVGAKNALYNLCLALLDEGDEVIFPAPYWTSYPDIVALAGGRSVPLQCPSAQNYKLTAAQLEAAMTPRTKIFLFNNPTNPTGMVYSREEVAALAAVLEKHDIWVISDDIYDKFTFDGVGFHHLLTAAPALRERTFVVQSVSKVYGMPGWRVGMAAGPAEVIKHLTTIMANTTMNVPGVSMAAAAAAFAGPQDFVAGHCATFAARRDQVLAALDAMDGVHCPRAQGAFYVFPDVSAVLGKQYKGEDITDDVRLCELLLEHAGVALVPGHAFGEPNAVRLSYACDEATLTEGLERLQGFFGACC